MMENDHLRIIYHLKKKVRDGKIYEVSLKSKRARQGFCHRYTDDGK
ncbi:MAG: hypothetical protein F6K24_07010 [Okeania sp. SIO2D1]|nr:hypothetical protein [Okeania sp. SIO2D1]